MPFRRLWAPTHGGAVVHAVAAHVHVVAARSRSHPETGNADADADAGLAEIESERPSTQTFADVETHRIPLRINPVDDRPMSGLRRRDVRAQNQGNVCPARVITVSMETPTNM